LKKYRDNLLTQYRTHPNGHSIILLSLLILNGFFLNSHNFLMRICLSLIISITPRKQPFYFSGYLLLLQI